MNMFLSTLYDQESSQMDCFFFFVWLCFGPDFPRIQYVAQAGLPLQSNLVYQTPEL